MDPVEWPMRDLRDPAALRALAHPIRLRILQELGLRGPSTATELAELVGESPANCSWHLRQLAKYGFIEEAGGGTGRQRPWQIVPRGTRWGDDPAGASPELALAEDAMTRAVIDRTTTDLRDWNTRRRHAAPEWQQASFLTENLAFLTPAELQELRDAVNAIILTHQERLADPTRRPPDARPVHLMAWGFPGAEGGPV